jgi:hypothetical protein
MRTELALLLTNDGPVMFAPKVAELLDITERTLENQIYAEKCPIPMFKLGSKWAAHVSDVAAYIDRQATEARNSPRFSGATDMLPTGRKAA